MTPEAALRDIRGFASVGRVRIEYHARQRMKERRVKFTDVVHALADARQCTLQENDRWRVHGPDLDGDELTVIVVLDAGVVVITLF